MDDLAFKALLGDFPADGSADQSAIVRQLRDQNEMGQLYSMSPTLAPQGQQMQQSALKSATEMGDRRSQGLTRARQQQQDAFDKQKHEDTMRGYTDIKQYRDPDGKIVTRGINKKTGVMEDIQTGYEEEVKKTAGKEWFSTTLSTGEKALVNSNTGKVRIGGRLYDSLDEADYEASLGRMAKGAANKVEAQDWAKFDVEEAGDRINSIVGLDSSFADQDAVMDDMIAAIDDKASSGRISDFFVTLTDATARLESAKSKLALASLEQYKLTPVSDRDLAELKKSANPNLTPAQLRKWALHRKEGIRRAREANRVMEDYLRKHKRVPQTEAERKVLRDQMQAIRTEGGYNFAYKDSEPDADFTEEEEVATAETVTETPKFKVGYDRTTGITTLSDGTRWDENGVEITQ